MNKEKIKSKIEKNSIVKHRIKRLRSKLNNRDITFLVPNCLGGILFHDLGLRFLSPTVNLMMKQTDFLELVLHLDDYLNGNFRFIKHPDYDCPCAYLSDLNSGGGIISCFYSL